MINKLTNKINYNIKIPMNIRKTIKKKESINCKLTSKMLLAELNSYIDILDICCKIESI